MTGGDRDTRTVLGTAAVVRELRAAAPLARALAAPATAESPWLTTVLSVQAVHRRPRLVPAAVVVGPRGPGGPDALALLELATAGPVVTATLLGDGLPTPGGRPPARLPARDEDAADRLAAGVLDLLTSVRRPWRLRLAGLPLGDPTVRALARLRPDARVASARTTRLVDDLDAAAPGRVVRSRDARAVDRVLPGLLAGERDARARDLVRAAARLHAALGRVEVATVTDGGRLRAGLLTLVDGADRLPWWGHSELGGLTTARGAPAVGVTVSGRGRVLRAVLDRGAARLARVPLSRRRGSG
ncbi:hypothetical protein SAMN05660690_0365 [Geodermatophilus telluris]|uniref:BioF2-like acetyltransferase domain-containing protein n=1 Tax=Geodermatophilus telluris TaxID=1190417 RepID=A0A1G6IGI0_9ACTN|nr:hypothetical protein [Geodermatophilus telluris]SDC05503.1 hypothetical protein SAMN05660690_0365 [Geodermatophilus telluris]